eukprot:7614880-Heterocapsa_arctica.AAC.1
MAGDVVAWLKEIGLTSQIRIMTDFEQSIRALMAQVAQRRGGRDLTISEVSPIKTSSSLGAAERYARTLAGIVRTLKCGVPLDF